MDKKKRTLVITYNSIPDKGRVFKEQIKPRACLVATLYSYCNAQTKNLQFYSIQYCKHITGNRCVAIVMHVEVILLPCYPVRLHVQRYKTRGTVNNELHVVSYCAT